MRYTFETEEAEEAEVLLNASDVKLAIWEFSKYLRDTIKYSDREDLATFEEIRSRLIGEFEGLQGDYIR